MNGIDGSPGTLTCPKGHPSADSDYCSECGAKIGGAARDNAVLSATHTTAAEICPDCGTVRDQKEIAFCEVCGYNFTTGAHGEVPIVPMPSTIPAQAEPDASSTMPPEDAPEPVHSAPVQEWTLTVSVDPALRAPDSPETPVGTAPFEVNLQLPVNLIGRHDESRAIFPEIALDHDEAVSRRHALLQLDPQGGLLLRDIGAANGTRLNGTDLQPMTDYPVNSGDEITLGHWSRLKLESKQR